MNWKENIEAQIARAEYANENVQDFPFAHTADLATKLHALLDVAVAADAWSCVEPIAARQAESDLHDALDKLREVGDGH